MMAVDMLLLLSLLLTMLLVRRLAHLEGALQILELFQLHLLLYRLFILVDGEKVPLVENGASMRLAHSRLLDLDLTRVGI